MDQETLSLLEFPQLLDIVQSFAHSPMGQAEARRLLPGLAETELRLRLSRIQEAMSYSASGSRLDFHEIEDPLELLARLSVAGEILEPKELLTLLTLLKRFEQVRVALKPSDYPYLAKLTAAVPPLDYLIGEIERVIDPAGEIRESADPELARARREQGRCREDIQSHLQGYFSGQRAKFLIQDPYITLRNERYVIPVKVEHQRDLPGVVHGTSSSGATLFVEPFPVVQLNNQYRYHQEREREILRRILLRLADRLRGDTASFREAAEAIACLDALFACAVFAIRYRCVIPRLEAGRRLTLRQARHPLLVQRLGDQNVVPISIDLDGDRSVLIVSGPNAGGKTVALKTVGLLSAMASAGLPTPAEDAGIPLFATILADIGDHQSLEQQLSTFSAHILRLKSMLELLQTPSLVLLDEVGAGTDPAHGAVLGISVVDIFRRREALVVATTHHQAIKQFAFATPGVQNASVELDEETLRPTYHLKTGVAGGSSGLEIAAMLGLPQEVVDQARSLLKKQDLQAERYLAELRAELARLETQKEELAEEKTRLEAEQVQQRLEHERLELARRKAADEALARWSSEFHSEAEKVVKSVKDRFEAARLRKEMKLKQAALQEAFRRKMAAERSAQKSGSVERGDQEPLRIGDLVYHSFFRKRGKLISVSGDDAVVEIDGKRVSTSLDQLQKGQGSGDEKPTRPPLPSNVRLDAVEESEPELNLIGQNVEDALALTDKFLDRAFLAALGEVRIIHGFGKGRLKSALAAFLDDHPHVLKHRVEGGVTVVSIRH
jgi:DNA mismatch repair protein MutS2